MTFPGQQLLFNILSRFKKDLRQKSRGWQQCNPGLDVGPQTGFESLNTLRTNFMLPSTNLYWNPEFCSPGREPGHSILLSQCQYPLGPTNPQLPYLTYFSVRCFKNCLVETRQLRQEIIPLTLTTFTFLFPSWMNCFPTLSLEEVLEVWVASVVHPTFLHQKLQSIFVGVSSMPGSDSKVTQTRPPAFILKEHIKTPCSWNLLGIQVKDSWTKISTQLCILYSFKKKGDRRA